jgi:AraC-like DNA-binding protein
MRLSRAASPTLPVPAAAAAVARSWMVGGFTLHHGPQGCRSAPAHGAEVLIPQGLPLRLRCGSLEHLLQPGAALLWLPAIGAAAGAATGAEPLWRTSPLQGWRVCLEPERLIAVAVDLAGHRLSPARCRRRLAQPQPLQTAVVGSAGPLLASLDLQLRQCVVLPRRCQHELVGLDQVILRLLALLLCGDLIEAAADGPPQLRPHQTRLLLIEELLVWIRANLHRPIPLAELSARSGYSARALRYIFQERFGCPPARWIRRQRLEAARTRLLSPAPGDSVSSIAAACGYAHLTQFSRDFHAAFRMPPSLLLREGRRGLALAPPCAAHTEP